MALFGDHKDTAPKRGRKSGNESLPNSSQAPTPATAVPSPAAAPSRMS